MSFVDVQSTLNSMCVILSIYVIYVCFQVGYSLVVILHLCLVIMGYMASWPCYSHWLSCMPNLSMHNLKKITYITPTPFVV
jgi:hypothetical protein